MENKLWKSDAEGSLVAAAMAIIGYNISTRLVRVLQTKGILSDAEAKEFVDGVMLEIEQAAGDLPESLMSASLVASKVLGEAAVFKE